MSQESGKDENVKEHLLTQDQELRFEVSNKDVVLEMVDGEAELFGKPLIRYKKYTFPAGKTIIYISIFLRQFI